MVQGLGLPKLRNSTKTDSRKKSIHSCDQTRTGPVGDCTRSTDRAISNVSMAPGILQSIAACSPFLFEKPLRADLDLASGETQVRSATIVVSLACFQMQHNGPANGFPDSTIAEHTTSDRISRTVTVSWRDRASKPVSYDFEPGLWCQNADIENWGAERRTSSAALSGPRPYGSPVEYSDHRCSRRPAVRRGAPSETVRAPDQTHLPRCQCGCSVGTSRAPARWQSAIFD
jgi:hypothetical protein